MTLRHLPFAALFALAACGGGDTQADPAAGSSGPAAAGASSADATVAQGSGAAAGGPGDAALPADVAAFVEKRDTCDHFRGEEPYDDERAKFIGEQLEANCTGTDAELARLRAAHAADPAIMARLADYEDTIE